MGGSPLAARVCGATRRWKMASPAQQAGDEWGLVSALDAAPVASARRRCAAMFLALLALLDLARVLLLVDGILREAVIDECPSAWDQAGGEGRASGPLGAGAERLAPVVHDFLLDTDDTVNDACAPTSRGAAVATARSVHFFGVQLPPHFARLSIITENRHVSELPSAADLLLEFGGVRAALSAYVNDTSALKRAATAAWERHVCARALETEEAVAAEIEATRKLWLVKSVAELELEREAVVLREECTAATARRIERVAARKAMFLPPAPLLPRGNSRQSEDANDGHDRPFEDLDLSRQDLTFIAMCTLWFIVSTAALCFMLLAPLRHDMREIGELAMGWCERRQRAGLHQDAGTASSSRDRNLRAARAGAPNKIIGDGFNRTGARLCAAEQARQRTLALARRHLLCLAVLGAGGYILHAAAYEYGWLDRGARVTAFVHHMAWSLEPFISREDGCWSNVLSEGVPFVLHIARSYAWMVPLAKFGGACRALSAQQHELRMALEGGSIALPRAHEWLHTATTACQQISELTSPFLTIFVFGAVALAIFGLYSVLFVGMSPSQLFVVSGWGVIDLVALSALLRAGVEVSDAAGELASCLDQPMVIQRYTAITRPGAPEHGSTRSNGWSENSGGGGALSPTARSPAPLSPARLAPYSAGSSGSGAREATNHCDSQQHPESGSARSSSHSPSVFSRGQKVPALALAGSTMRSDGSARGAVIAPPTTRQAASLASARFASLEAHAQLADLRGAALRSPPCVVIAGVVRLDREFVGQVVLALATYFFLLATW